MASRLQRQTLRYKGDQAGCMQGLINIFDFRHGRTTRRLLSDKRRANKQVVGVEHSSAHRILLPLAEVHENAVDAEEPMMPTPDNTRSSVKELMEKEMSKEKGPGNQSNCTEINLEKVNPEHQNTTENNNVDDAKSLTPENFHQFPEVKPSDDLSLEVIMQELAKINLRSYSECINDDLHDEKIGAAVDLFIEQRSSESKHLGEERESCLSKECTDALETLSSNKGLFMKLLQDRKSPFVKHIEDLEDSRLLKDRTCSSFHAYNSSEEKRKDLKSDKFSSRRHLNFFHRRSKSVDSHPLSPETDVDVSTISLRSSPQIDNKVQKERNLSHFSFSEIKRKLRRGISPGRWILKFSSTHRNRESSGENFYSERFANTPTSFKRGEQVKKSKDSGSAMVNKTCQGPSNIYIEAKRHLYEMLNDRDEKAEKLTREAPKSLGRVLSLPEYSGSHICSPRKHNDDVTLISRMASSPCGSIENNLNEFLRENHSNHGSPSRQHMECQPWKQDDGVQCQNMNISSSSKGESEYSSEIQSSTEDAITVEVSSSSSNVEEIQETTGFSPQEEEKSTNICSESSTEVTGGTHDEDIKELEDASQCLVESNLFEELHTSSSPSLSPTSSPLHRESKHSECAIDRTERPSPVSVLEPLFTDDDVSPSHTISQPVEKEFQPRHIDFEEQTSSNSQENCMRISLEDEESEFEYVEAVLLGSGLNWDEFVTRWISFQEILDPFFFDEVEIFSGRPRHDQHLLFDCANEVLEELCEGYFGTLHSKQNIRPVPKGMDLIHNVWGQIECFLFQNLMVCSLDQLVRLDMVKSGNWMNIESDIVEILSYEMEEMIFDELVDDTVLSFLDCTSECKFEAI